MRRVLLLNITYEPLTTVGLHRAVCLVLGDKAEIVHEDSRGIVLHSASARLAAPSVIKLRRYVRVPYRSRIPGKPPGRGAEGEGMIRHEIASSSPHAQH